MSVAHDYESMHHLVDRMSPTQVRRLMLLVTQDEELAPVAEGLAGGDEGQDAEGDEGAVRPGLLSLVGSIDGPADLAERHDEHIRERMREHFGDPE